MASVQRHPKSPYWMAHYTGKGGKRHTKSTKLKAIAGNRKEAQKISDSYEEAYRSNNVIRALRDNYEKISKDLNKSWSIPTVKNYFDMWIEKHSPNLKSGTLMKYRHRIKDFTSFLDKSGRSDLFVNELMEDERIPIEYRNRLLGTVSTSTAKTAINTLSFMFNDGLSEGYYLKNYFKNVANIRVIDSVEKSAFKLDELKLVLESCDPEWKSMVLFGLYTGQRLSDIAGLTWGQIDLKKSEISFITKKTGRRMALPIAKPLKSHILTLRRGTPDAPLHTNSHRIIEEQGRPATLSRQFNEILQKCNLVEKRSHRKRKTEDLSGVNSNKKNVNPLSFHSLRHTAGTLLRMTGASEAVSREIIGHDSVSVDRNYVHMDAGSMQTALDQLPDITSA